VSCYAGTHPFKLSQTCANGCESEVESVRTAARVGQPSPGVLFG
jgi:hypothetical protein